MGRTLIVAILLVVLLVTLAACGSTAKSPTPLTSPTTQGMSIQETQSPTLTAKPTPTPTATATYVVIPTSTTTAQPKDVVPISVLGFTLDKAGEQRTSGAGDRINEGVENHFVPKHDSIYWGKVGELVIQVQRFKDETTCKEVLDEITSFSDVLWTQISVVGEAQINYFADSSGGSADIVQQRGRLLISSISLSQFDDINPDEEILKQAVIEGLKAIGH